MANRKLSRQELDAWDRGLDEVLAESFIDREKMDETLSFERANAKAIEQEIQLAKNALEAVIKHKSTYKAFRRTTGDSQREAHIKEAAMHQFLRRNGLLDLFYASQPYNPITGSDNITGPGNSILTHCIEIVGQTRFPELRLTYFYYTGQEGYEESLYLIHKRCDNPPFRDYESMMRVAAQTQLHRPVSQS